MVLLKFTKWFLRFFIDNEQTLLVLLSVSKSKISGDDDYENGKIEIATICIEVDVSLLNYITTSMTKNGRSVKLEVLYGTMHTILGRLMLNLLHKFSVCSENKRWTCLRIVISYYWTRKGKDMSVQSAMLPSWMKAVKVMKLDLASNNYSREGKPISRFLQLTRDKYKISLEGLKFDTSNVFAHRKTAARKETVSSVKKIGNDSYFNNRPATQPSWIVLTVVKSGFIDGRKDVRLKYFNKVDETVSKNTKFWNHVQRVIAGNFFRPTLLKRFSVVLVKGDNKLY